MVDVIDIPRNVTRNLHDTCDQLRYKEEDNHSEQSDPGGNGQGHRYRTHGFEFLFCRQKRQGSRSAKTIENRL